MGCESREGAWPGAPRPVEGLRLALCSILSCVLEIEHFHSRLSFLAAPEDSGSVRLSRAGASSSAGVPCAPPLSEPCEDREAHAEASRVRDAAGGVGRASRWLSRPLAKALPRGTRGQCVSGLRAPGLRTPGLRAPGLRAPGCVVPAATPGCPGRRLRARPHPSPSDKHSPAPDGQAPGCGRQGEQRISAFEFTVSGRDGP